MCDEVYTRVHEPFFLLDLVIGEIHSCCVNFNVYAVFYFIHVKFITLEMMTPIWSSPIYSTLPLNHLQLKTLLSILTRLIFVEPASCIDASIKEKTW